MPVPERAMFSAILIDRSSDRKSPDLTCEISAIKIRRDCAKIAANHLVCPLPRKSSVIAGDQVRRDERQSTLCNLRVHLIGYIEEETKTYLISP